MTMSDAIAGDVDIPGDPPDPGQIPEGLTGPFFQKIGKRKKQGRDAKILLTAKDGQTGVGKSNLSDFLAYVCDTSTTGFQRFKATIDPHQFLKLYGVAPKGSSVVMEEGEQFSSRRAMSSENVDAIEKWQMARVREIVSIVNLPSPKAIDSMLERLCDFWINVEIRGRARVYEKHIHPIKRNIYYKTVQVIEWPNMDQSPTFKAMQKMKADLLDDDTKDSNWVRESEVKERLEKARKEERRKVRDRFIAALYETTDLTGNDISSLGCVDIGDKRVRQIPNEVDDDQY